MGATRYVAGDLSSIDMETVLAHDALTDTPIPSFYRELDARFPGSRFILTVRDREGWLKSCRKQFNERSAAAQNDAHRRIFEDLYGTNVFDEQRFARGYERFVAGVFEYFRNRTRDLLVLNVTEGDGWEKLCPFVERPVPDIPFPKANVTKIRWMSIEDLVAVAEAAGRELLKRYKGDVEPAALGARASALPTPAGVLDRALQAALGRDTTEAALKAAYKVIVAGLKRLNAEIPVLSPIESPPPYSERRHWNHVWLVDPLDGREAFAGGGRNFSVNLALVEDGRPIYGVVHAPAQATTYFGRIGRGAHRRVGGGAAVRAFIGLSEDVVAGSASGRTAIEADRDSRSLALCALLDETPRALPVDGPAPEWRTAAACAVLNAAQPHTGEDAVQAGSTFNSEHLTALALPMRWKAPA
jgi:fructose-1,6-bisphosphatase/inositol monophosphatase family enzyme